ncbi:MAG: hypothetical protein K9L86_06340 [Candidatus Omnitrophica bacterium]|nr:hypothetical protein [Candidatus Omnitrophota bacterium]
MLQQYSPGEILKIAVEVEKNGKDLYEALASESQDEKTEQLWSYLKEQEEIHRELFQKMLDNQKDYLIFEFSPGEHQAYLGAIASEYIFTQGLIKKFISQRFENSNQAIDFGISVEKISILTYTALREYIKKDKLAVLDKIIKEEEKHLVQLKNLKHILT